MTCKKKGLLVFISVCIFFLLSQTTSESYDINARLSLDKNSIYLGEPVTATLKISYPKECLIDDIPFFRSDNEAMILSLYRSERVFKDDRFHDSIDVQLVYFTIGTFEIGAHDIYFKDIQKQTNFFVPVAATDLVVKSVLPEVVENRDILDVKNFQTKKMITGKDVYLWLVLLAISIIVVRFCANKITSIANTVQPGVSMLISPHEQAYQRLESLHNSNFLKEGRVKEFYSQLSSIIREYISFRYKVLIHDKTTQDIIDLLPLLNLNKQQTELLIKIFHECDLVKFAKLKPTFENICLSLLSAKKIIDDTKEVVADN
jgi:hypothetical protein